MKFIIKHIKWVMLVSGVLTSTMFFGLFAPEAALQYMFGASFNGTLESLVVRSWSALVGLVGVVLIYGAFSERNRVFAISIASASKVIFVSLVLLYGTDYLGKATPAIAMDCVVVFLTAVFLMAVHIERLATQSDSRRDAPR
jgi:hypothetical protein